MLFILHGFAHAVEPIFLVGWLIPVLGTSTVLTVTSGRWLTDRLETTRWR